jgi:hypothetical protein
VQEISAGVDRVGDRGQMAIELAHSDRVQQQALRFPGTRCRTLGSIISLDEELLAFAESSAHDADHRAHAGPNRDRASTATSKITCSRHDLAGVSATNDQRTSGRLSGSSGSPTRRPGRACGPIGQMLASFAVR